MKYSSKCIHVYMNEFIYLIIWIISLHNHFISSESFEKNNHKQSVMDMFSNEGQVSTTSLSSCPSTHNVRSNSSSSSSSVSSSGAQKTRSHWPFSKKTWWPNELLFLHNYTSCWSGLLYQNMSCSVSYFYIPFVYLY